MQRKIEEEFGDANSYVMDLQDNIDKTDEKINKIGDLEQRPTTYYDTIKEAYEHRNNVENLKNVDDPGQEDYFCTSVSSHANRFDVKVTESPPTRSFSPYPRFMATMC